MDVLKEQCHEYIPTRNILERKQTHPWLTEECHRAIDLKNQAIGTPQFQNLQGTCAEVLNIAYKAYEQDLKDRIKSLKKSDKRWWALNRQLLHRKAKMSSIPALRSDDGEWHQDSQTKANIFAQVFDEKSQLPPIPDDQFVDAPSQIQHGFVAIRIRHILKLLKMLSVNKATWPDGFSAKILKELAEVLAWPLTLLCRRILYEHTWPEIWKVHSIVPIYIKNSIYKASHY